MYTYHTFINEYTTCSILPTMGTTAETTLHRPNPVLFAKEQDEVCKCQGQHQAAKQFVLGIDQK